MNVFLTVGTTPFDSLVQAIDQGEFAQSTLMQVAEGHYEPAKSEWFRFDPSLDRFINEADIVVCHAGAGSVFRLIQSGIVPVVVPNMERRDIHQIELAGWLKRKNYALVAEDPRNVNQVLNQYSEKAKQCVKFEEARFFFADHLNSLIKTSLD